MAITHLHLDPVSVQQYVKEQVAGKQAAAQADSVAADTAALRTDFNALLAKLRAADIIAT